MANYGCPEHIKARLSDRHGGAYIGEGWFDLVTKLDADIAKLCPDYTIGQVKEKFGGLRYYINSIPENVSEQVYDLINIAERQSQEICDVCGGEGKGISLKGWYVTRCDKHETSTS